MTRSHHCRLKKARPPALARMFESEQGRFRMLLELLGLSLVS